MLTEEALEESANCVKYFPKDKCEHNLKVIEELRRSCTQALTHIARQIFHIGRIDQAIC